MKKNLLLVGLLLVFSACENQVGTAVTSTFSNIISGRAFQDSSSNEAYKALKEASLSKPQMDSVSPNCIPLDVMNTLSVSEEENFSTIKDQLCTCTAWGTCDAKSCSCKLLCPKDFGIFKKVNHWERDSFENTLSFTNNDNRYASSDPTYNGYCWGIATVTQRFNRLATFDPAAVKKHATMEEESLRLQEYRNIIAQINRNEPVTIPGFRSLEDFSSDPEVKNLLEESVKDVWGASATTTQGLGMVTSTKTPGTKELNELFDDLEFRLKNNLSPSIVYNEKESVTRAHVLQVSGSGTNLQGERYLCLRDNNFKADYSMDCNIKMIMKKDGRVVNEYGPYNPYRISPIEIGKIALTHTENTDTMEQMHNLHNKCAGEKGCEKSELK